MDDLADLVVAAAVGDLHERQLRRLRSEDVRTYRRIAVDLLRLEHRVTGGRVRHDPAVEVGLGHRVRGCERARLARVELGADNYSAVIRINGHPGAGIGIFLDPGANALSTSKLVKSYMANATSRLRVAASCQLKLSDGSAANRAMVRITASASSSS